MEKIRKPSFAGKFYPAKQEELTSLIQTICDIEQKNVPSSDRYNDRLIGGVSPHAGYVFSAYQAIHLYNVIAAGTEPFDTFVIINPNHTGQGSSDFNLCDYTAWDTPLGRVSIDTEMQKLLNIEVNNHAHDMEHSGEVQIPLLQYLLKYPFNILPITMNRQNPNSAKALATMIHQAASQLDRKIFLIASSDFSHYLPPQLGAQIDEAVLKCMVSFDTHSTFQMVKDLKATICGFGPIMTLMEYSRLIATKPVFSILRRGHSGEIHPSDKVVDYVAMVVHEKMH